MSAVDVHVFRESVSRIVRALSDSQIKVRQQGMRAYVDFDTKGRPLQVTLPSIPDNASMDMLNAIQGFLDHEVGHLLFTDFTFAAKQTSTCRAKRDTIRPALWNVIEDVFVERRMTKKFTGSLVNIDNIRRFLTGKILKDGYDELVGRNAEPHEFVSYLMPSAIRAAAGQRPFVDFMSDKWHLFGLMGEGIKAMGDKFLKANSTQDCWGLVDELHDVICPPKPPAPPAPPAPKPPTPPPPPPKDEQDDEEDEDKDDDNQGDGDSEGEQSEDAESEENESDEADGDEADGTPEPPENEEEQPEPDEEEQPESDSDSPPWDDEQEEEESDDDGDDEDADDDGDDEDADEDGDKGAGSAAADDDAEDSENETDSDAENDGDAGDDDSGEQDTDDEPGESSSDPDSERDESFDPDGGKYGEEVEEETLIEDLIDPSLIKPLDDYAAEAIERELAEHIAANPHDYMPFTRDHDYVGPLPAAEHFKRQSLEHCPVAKSASDMCHVVQSEIERIFKARSASRWNPGQRRGKVNRGGLHRLALGDDRVFRQKIEAQSKEIAISLVLDCSGSMHGTKITYAATAAYMLATVLERINIPVEILGFTTMNGAIEGHRDVKEWNAIYKEMHANSYSRQYSRYAPICLYLFKEFQKRFDDDARKTIGFLPSAYGFMMNNVDGESIEMAAMRLRLRKEPRKIMIVMSDGQPASDGPDLIQKTKLKQVVTDIARSGVDIYGLGLLDRSVLDYYPKAEVVANAAEIPAKVIALAQRLLVS